MMIGRKKKSTQSKSETAKSADLIKVSCLTGTRVMHDFGIFPTNGDDNDNRTIFVDKELWDEYTKSKSNFKDAEAKLLKIWGENGSQ